MTRAAPVPMAPATASAVRSPPPSSTRARPCTSATTSAARVQLARLPVPRPVEVDDVQPGRALRHEPRRHRDRVGLVGHLAVEVALTQADHAPAANVDRRQQLEHRERDRAADR